MKSFPSERSGTWKFRLKIAIFKIGIAISDFSLLHHRYIKRYSRQECAARDIYMYAILE